MNTPTTNDVILMLAQLGRQLDAKQEEIARLDEEAVRAKARFEVAHAKANILVMCSLVNGLIESDSKWASAAREYGWKLSRWESPEETPFYDLATGTWNLIDNTYHRVITTKKAA